MVQSMKKAAILDLLQAFKNVQFYINYKTNKLLYKFIYFLIFNVKPAGEQLFDFRIQIILIIPQ